MARSSSSVLRSLNGLFSVYKPPGVICSNLYETLSMKLLKDLNSLQHSSKQNILFLPEGSEGCSGVELTKVVTSVPSLVDHVLVKGPAYTSLKIGVGHILDKQSSGVLVFGIGHGTKLLTVMHENHYTRDYTVCGTFGKATSDFSDAGKVIEKTTFNHITKDKFERVLAMIQGVNHKALIMNSRVDLKSQEAYDLAVQGQLRPKEKSPPLILAVRCLDFSPPDFTLEIRCMHETQKYLRKVIHEIGLELRSTAICTKVRRTRDGPFTLDCALTRAHWDLDSVSKAIKEFHPKVNEILKESMDFTLKNTNSEELHSTEERGF
ncbi:PREDICTED: probable tRNA pseudouridine synthase 2 [Nanorana parkeri]|uniref:probable tRNA pseudouridine synthase 2 n=1 Tax=Nanorana parkeri TaxID=125878 RepID=UPI000853F2BD|nr:PREDICTED: probable tRNA pseudouridine synthase 2 [Nanorana parkeri]